MDIRIEKDCPVEIINVCPKKIFSQESRKVVAKDKEKCDVCEACTDFCKKQNVKGIELVSTKNLIITLESFGQLSAEDIFKKAIGALKKDLATSL